MISCAHPGPCARVGNQVIQPPPKWGNLTVSDCSGREPRGATMLDLPVNTGVV